MSVLCLAVSSVAEAMINSGKFSVISVRRLMNSIGQYVPALGLAIVAFAGCDTTLAVTALALGFGCNAATFSGFQVWMDQPKLKQYTLKPSNTAYYIIQCCQVFIYIFMSSPLTVR